MTLHILHSLVSRISSFYKLFVDFSSEERGDGRESLPESLHEDLMLAIKIQITIIMFKYLEFHLLFVMI